MVALAGVRVDLAGVEAVLRQQPGVAAAAAQAWPLPSNRGTLTHTHALHRSLVMLYATYFKPDLPHSEHATAAACHCSSTAIV